MIWWWLAPPYSLSSLALWPLSGSHIRSVLFSLLLLILLRLGLYFPEIASDVSNLASRSWAVLQSHPRPNRAFGLNSNYVGDTVSTEEVRRGVSRGDWGVKRSRVLHLILITHNLTLKSRRVFNIFLLFFNSHLFADHRDKYNVRSIFQALLPFSTNANPPRNSQSCNRTGTYPLRGSPFYNSIWREGRNTLIAVRISAAITSVIEHAEASIVEGGWWKWQSSVM